MSDELTVVDLAEQRADEARDADCRTDEMRLREIGRVWEIMYKIRLGIATDEEREWSRNWVREHYKPEEHKS